MMALIIKKTQNIIVSLYQGKFKMELFYITAFQTACTKCTYSIYKIKKKR